MNLTRYHGILAPNHKHRAEVINKKDDKQPTQAEGIKSEAEKRISMTWAARLQRVLDIDIKVCAACGDTVKIIASIEDQATINKILSHLLLIPQSNQVILPFNHAPPAQLRIK